ncbi:Chk1 protein kinase [Trebouxia sp. C0009 RCD-2024]
MAYNISAPTSEATLQAFNQPLSEPLEAALDPEQEEPDAPWDARRQLRLYKTRANSAGLAWKGPWRTVPTAFAPDKYRLLDEKPFTASSDPLELLTEPGLIKTSFCGNSYYGEKKTKRGWTAVTIKKRLLQPLGWHPPEQAALQEEAALMAVQQALQLTPLPHHITHYLDSFRHTDPTYGLDCMYFVTKFEEGADLDVHFRELHQAWQSPGDAMNIVHAAKQCFKQMLQGLKVLHDCGWGHMNLKPSKVQVRVNTDGTYHCTIVDLAASMGEKHPYTGLHNTCHASPQLMEGLGLGVLRNIDYKPHDIWGMGCLLLQMLINGNPFQPSTWSKPPPFPVTPLAMQTWFCEEMRLMHSKWATSFIDGHAMPEYAASLANLILDMQQHKVVARLLRGLLHPDSACRYTVDQALNDDFLYGI